MKLSNNSTSDSCGLIQYGISELALHAPNLVDDLRAIDLVKMTVDRYLDGEKGFERGDFQGVCENGMTPDWSHDLPINVIH